jgi:diaminohydroxyphosphoribosylaminopyrimidine deaminase/5-amino-6-(5-phosphoribosylamino)uracil reductase
VEADAERGELPADQQWMELALELARRCPPSESAYSVGAVVVAADGTELARGYSRDTDAHNHAEESALGRASTCSGLGEGATLYSTMEPCSRRRSRPRGCAQLIVDTGIRRVVTATREPALFVADCQGYSLLEAAGVEVIELPRLAAQALKVNAHLGFDR